MNKREREIQQVYLNNEKAVLKELEKAYKDALKQINFKLQALMARQDADMAHVIYQIEYQKNLKTQVKSILEELQSREFETLTEFLSEAYEDGFIGAMYDLQGQGIEMILPIDQEQMIEAIQHETQLNASLYEELGVDIKDLQKKIGGEISRGIATGMSYADIARNISFMSSIPMNRAMTIARTESHRIQCRSSYNAYEKASKKGADIVKIWDSALDKKTRKSHRELDGQIRELDEPFEVNGKKAMFPGDFHDPAEDCNCRCAIISRPRWALGEDYTKWSEEASDLTDGKEPLVTIKAKNYEEFKKKYQKASEFASDSFAQRLAQTELSPHWREYTDADEYLRAKKDFSGDETEYLDDVFRGEFDLNVGWHGEDTKRKIPKIENTLAELQKKYPMNPSKDLEFNTTIKKINVCDYDEAFSFLPNGLGDVRLTDGAVGQVFFDGDMVTIAFDRKWMSQTLEETIEERAKSLLTGKVLPSVCGSSPEFVAIHEWGHIMEQHLMNAVIYDDDVGLEYWKWYKTLSKDEIETGLSNYAKTNRSEFAAECFAELQMPNPRPLALKYFDFLERAIEKGY